MAKNLIAWDGVYSVGMNEIDEQHKLLFDIINTLWDAVILRQDGAAVLHTIAELERYTLTHFTAEESFMRAHNYSGFDEHKKQHVAFIERIRQERQAVEGGASVTLDLINFLKDWLIDHILVKDKAYAAEFQPKKLGGGLGGFFARLFR